MRKLILALAIAVTAGNLANAAYAAICQGVNGGRACGSICTGLADGACGCTGSCSAEELKWVDGAGPKSAAMEEELAY
jgi:hypothetical protein